MASTAEFQKYGGGRLYGLNERVNCGPVCSLLSVSEKKSAEIYENQKIPRVRACS